MKGLLNSVWNLSIFCLIYLTTNVYCDGKCGIQDSSTNDRIVNGNNLRIQQLYPWFVALVPPDNNQKISCGGTLITDRHVLTAAHCYEEHFENAKNGTKPLEEIYVAKLGVRNICNNKPAPQIFAAIKVHIHEQYYTDLFFYDIAIMVLESRATNFMPICLPPARYESNNRTTSNCSIIGLGKLTPNAFMPSCLVIQAFVPIQSDSICKEMFRKYYKQEKFQDVFCAGYPEGGTGACQGDNGGPLQVYRNSSDTWMILGITSFGESCGQLGEYSVYTDVSHYLDWIYGKIKYDEEHNYIFESEPKPVTKNTALTKIRKAFPKKKH